MRIEKDVKKAVKKILDDHKWFWWMPPANGFGRVGVADFNGLRDGVFIAVETKFGNRKPTPHQVGFLSSVAAENGFAFVVRDTTLDHFKAWMEAFDRSVVAQSHGKEVAPEDGSIMLNAMKVLTEDLA